MRAEVVGIIPARYASTRFPGKPLHLLGGKPLVQHVWERCRRARALHRVIVATDDRRIARVAEGFGAEVALTSPDHPSGTDRLAEVARRLRTATHFVNVQGDEPLVDPGLVNRIAAALVRRDARPMVTAANPSRSVAEYLNPNVVKVVLDRAGDALYFSRAPIPLDRERAVAPPLLESHALAVGETAYGHPPELASPFLRHHGIYGYARELLLQFVRWKPTPLEQLEKLEQLRALEHGIRIRVLITPHASVGVDTPEDADAAERALACTGPSSPLKSARPTRP